MTSTATRRDPSVLQSSIFAGTVIVASTSADAFQQILMDGRHVLHADEPVAAGGGDTGPGPYELLLMALDEAQRVRLLEIGDHCPVHRTLTSRIEIRSALVSASE